MLNLFKLNSKNKTPKFSVTEEVKTSKHFPSSVREWKNSIYLYNSNALSLIPATTMSAIKIIKGYFTLFNKKIERKMRKRRLLLRLRRLCSNKIYISNGEFKHTNNKVIITLYMLNRQKHNYLLSLRKWYLKKFFGHVMLKNKEKISFRKFFFQRLNSLNIKGLKALKIANEEKYYLIEALNTINENKFAKNNKYLSRYVGKFYKKLVRKSFRKLRLYLYYKQLLYINRSKLNYTYLQYLKKYLEILYNKNVEFNLVNLKRFYLNSDILSEAITLKLTINRRKMLNYLNKLKNKVKIQKKRIFLGEPLYIDNHLNIQDDLTGKDNLLERDIVNELKYRHITGFRLEAKGRLTKRFTASRSVHKLRYKGNLLDNDSSYKGLSSVLLKGNLKSNVQFTKLHSKSRIGSFGIKGWVSGN